MPILVDYSQVMLASLFASIGNHTNTEIDEDTLRHMFLNSLRANRKQFTKEYGEVVLCVDAKKSWRKDVFPYYKASRKKKREESELDWPTIFGYIENIKNEIDRDFPYKVIQVDGAEADDIIGVICHEYGTEMWGGDEKFLILSGDKDFIQLHVYANVDQYSPVKNMFIKNSDPALYLAEQIVIGDKDDGVPNILSEDNCFIVGKRQGTMTAGRRELYRQGPGVMGDDETLKSRYERNKQLIDLSMTPDHIREGILEQYNTEKTVGRKNLFNYFIKYRLKGLMGFIQDF